MSYYKTAQSIQSEDVAACTKCDKYEQDGKVLSLKVANILAREKRPLEDGQLVAECLKAAGLTDVTSDLSPEILKEGLKLLSSHLKIDLNKELQECSHFGFLLDVCKDPDGRCSHLLVYIRMVFTNNDPSVQLLTTLTIRGGQTGHEGMDLFSCFYNRLLEMNIPLKRLTSIATNGTPMMVDSATNLITLCRRNSDFPKFVTYSPILNGRDVFEGVLNYKHVVSVIKNAVNLIRSKPLQRELFKNLLDEIRKVYGDLIVYTELHWPITSQVLSEFQNSISVILELPEDDWSSVSVHLKNPDWLLDLAFLVDMAPKFQNLNDLFQNKSVDIVDMMSMVDSFRSRLNLWKNQLMKGDFTHFPSMKSRNIQNNMVKYYSNIDNLYMAINQRFKELEKLKPALSFIADPSQDVGISETAKNLAEFGESAESLEMEITSLQNNLKLKPHMKTDNFWTLVSTKKYPSLKRVLLKVDSCFDSTNMSSVGLSTIEILKARYRSTLTDNELDDMMRVSLNKNDFNFKELVK